MFTYCERKWRSQLFAIYLENFRLYSKNNRTLTHIVLLLQFFIKKIKNGFSFFLVLRMRVVQKEWHIYNGLYVSRVSYHKQRAAPTYTRAVVLSALSRVRRRKKIVANGIVGVVDTLVFCFSPGGSLFEHPGRDKFSTIRTIVSYGLIPSMYSNFSDIFSFSTDERVYNN